MPRVIVSASGMLEGGRVLHHLKVCFLTIRILLSWQVSKLEGLGDQLNKGEKEIRIHGSMIPVRAQVLMMEGLSAHADSNELIQWLSSIKKPPIKVCLTHGEEATAQAFSEKVKSHFTWETVVPDYMDSIEI